MGTRIPHDIRSRRQPINRWLAALLVGVACGTLGTDVTATEPVRDVPGLNTDVGGHSPAQDAIISATSLSADWRHAAALTFEIRRRSGSGRLWVYTWFSNGAHERYQSPSRLLPLSEEWSTVTYSLAQLSPDWYPVGHLRDLDDTALANVREVGVSCSDAEFDGRIEIRRAGVVVATPSDSTDVQIIELGFLSEPLVDRVAELSFRINQPYTNPFSPDEADIWVEVMSPENQRLSVPAFYHQRFIPANEDGAREPIGAAVWCARFRPTTTGTHHFRIQISGRYQFDTESIPFQVRETSTVPTTAVVQASASGQCRRAYLERAGTTAFRWDRTHWTALYRGPLTGQFSYWDSHLQWGGRGDGVPYNLAHAVELDDALARADASGAALPMRLWGNEMFHDTSRHRDYPYRWRDNPYRRENGGPLARASAFFHDKGVRQASCQLLRYLYARYGAFRSCSGILVGTDFEVSGGTESWHHALATEWQTLAAGGHMQLWTLHPQANQTSASTSAAQPVLFSAVEARSGCVQRFAGPDVADWSAYDTLAIELDVPPTAPSAMSVVVAVQDNENGWFQVTLPSFLRPGDRNRLSVRLDARSRFIAMGHRGEWSAYNRMRIHTPEIRIYSPRPLPEPIPQIQAVLVPARTAGRAATELNDLRYSDTVSIGTMQEAKFRLSRSYANPFDSREVRIDAKMTGPDGTVQTIPAFLYQAYTTQDGGEEKSLSASGGTEWRWRYRPAVAGEYRFRLTLREDGTSARDIGSGKFRVHASDMAVADDAEWNGNVDSRFVVTPDVSDAYCARLGEGGWQQCNGLRWSQRSDKMWFMNVVWSPSWGGGYAGGLRFNLQRAHELDELLKTASGYLSWPMRLLGNEEFHNASTNAAHRYRWAQNPLNAENGGPLASPSSLFTEPECRQRFIDQARYLIARYGSFAAVDGFVIANDMPEAGAIEWHEQVGTALNRVVANRGIKVYSTHPFAAESDLVARTLHPGEWQLVPGETAGSDVVATYTATALELGDADWLSFRVQLPDDAPPGIRVMLAATDEDQWWYQSLNRAFLRPGDTTTVRFDLKRGVLMPHGHRRPWTAYSRFHLRGATLRFYSDSPFSGSIQLQAVTAWSEPESGPLTVSKRRAHTETVPVDGLYELDFELSNAFRNPFDPAEVAIVATITSPNSDSRSVNAYFDQQYRYVDERVVPDGAPFWRVRFSPKTVGQHEVALDGYVRGRHIPLSARYRFMATSAIPTNSDPQFTSEALLDVHDLTYSNCSVYQRTTTERGNSSEAWQHLSEPQAPKLWHAVLEWTSRWGRYRGMGRYNLEAAWRVDQELARAQAAGSAFPLRLNGTMEFRHRRGYRWPDNPLNTANGGLLAAPSDYYRNAQATTMQIQLWRYLIARYGEHPATTDFVLAADSPSDGAEQWHEQVGQALSAWIGPKRRLISYHPQAIPHGATSLMATFETSTESFQPASDIDGGAQTHVTRTTDWSSHGEAALAVRRRFVGQGEAPIVARIDQDWFSYDTLAMDVKLPDDSPHNMRVMIYLKDGDLWYYENLLKPSLVPGDVTRLIVDLTAAGGDWRPPVATEPPGPAHHSKPWTDTARSRIREIGIRIFSHDPFDGIIAVDNLQLWNSGRFMPTGPIQVTDFVGEPRVAVFSPFEFTFTLDRDFRNPFDPDEINIEFDFMGPAGTVHTVPAFYYQNYERQEIRQQCDIHGRLEAFEHLVPQGAPVWKVRYTPTAPGRHACMMRINGRPVTLADWSARLMVTPADTRGFIQVASDKRYFEYSTGEFFYPIGHNLRSPTDGRNMQTYRRYFTQEWHRGTFLYDDYFEKMSAAGMNYARIWQCSWWLGLEWTRAWHGYHGLGRYNMENAWRLDYLLRAAQKAGIYLQIDTTNHGQFSLKIDSEWKHNPFNASNGADRGPLKQPKEFFTNTVARKYYDQRIRYTGARWGHHPNVLSWIVMTECEFTDDYFKTAFKHGIAGRHAGLVNWHRYAIGQFQKWMPNHMVSTHFSHPFRGADVFAMPEVEFAHSNSYHQNWWFEKKGVPKDDTPAIHRYMYSDLLGMYDKPILVGEFGGDVKKNSAQQLDTELHVGSWSMVCAPYAGCTGYWWWPWLHYRNRYGKLKAVANFMADADRRHANVRAARIHSSGGLTAMGVQGEQWADIWIYDPALLRSRYHDLMQRQSENIRLSHVQAGRYEVQFWDTRRGEPIGRETVDSRSGDVSIQLPPFHGDIALKLRHP